jgi:hypothetical protein
MRTCGAARLSPLCYREEGVYTPTCETAHSPPFGKGGWGNLLLSTLRAAVPRPKSPIPLAKAKRKGMCAHFEPPTTSAPLWKRGVGKDLFANATRRRTWTPITSNTSFLCCKNLTIIELNNPRVFHSPPLGKGGLGGFDAKRCDTRAQITSNTSLPCVRT